MLGVALPSIIFWGIIIPVTLLFLIRRNKKNMNKHKIYAQLSFIIKGYKSEIPCTKWDIFYVEKVINDNNCPVWCDGLPSVWDLLSSIAILGMIRLQLRYKPFINWKCRGFELICSLHVISIWSGLENKWKLCYWYYSRDYDFYHSYNIHNMLGSVFFLTFFSFRLFSWSLNLFLEL